jgi:threonine/homoserine/homoserine lactone efflux protein
MVVGWSTLGLVVGMVTASIESNKAVFDALTYAGAAYIAYLGISMARSQAKSAEEAKETQRLGFRTGAALQLVNGKAWVHFVALMATWGTLFGEGIGSKFLLVMLNALAGYPAVLTWALFGTRLSLMMNSPQNAKRLNLGLGLSLVGVALWVVMPH